MPFFILLGLLGALISAVTGTLWYSNATPMGTWHMQGLGFDKLSKDERAKRVESAKADMPKLYGAQLALSFLSGAFIGFVTDYTVQSGGPADAVYFYVGAIWLAFTIPMIGQNILWGNASGALAWKKFFSDGAYNLVTYLLIAFIATLLV